MNKAFIQLHSDGLYYTKITSSSFKVVNFWQIWICKTPNNFMIFFFSLFISFISHCLQRDWQLHSKTLPWNTKLTIECLLYFLRGCCNLWSTAFRGKTVKQNLFRKHFTTAPFQSKFCKTKQTSWEFPRGAQDWRQKVNANTAHHHLTLSFFQY